MGLESLLPEFREQYGALVPEIERGVDADLMRRGMFYSGNATDSMARAKAALLAELAAKSGTTRAGQEEAALDRAAQERLAAESRKEARRAQNLGFTSAGLGALTTGLGLYAMRPQSGMGNIIPGPYGNFYTFDPSTGIATPISYAGGGAAGVPGAVAGPMGGGVPGLAGGADVGVYGGYGRPTAGLPDVSGMGGGRGGGAATAPTTSSMWKDAGWQAAGGLAGGLAGRGLAGLGGASGMGADIGAGLGGLGGLFGGAALGPRLGFAQNSPWAAGLGALLGSAGGGLLGGLF